jgi:hypothetical protein
MKATRRGIRVGLIIGLLFFVIATIALTAPDRLLSWMTPGRVAAVQQGEDLTPVTINATVARQLESLVVEKRSRSRAQRKIDSQLLFAMKARRGEPITSEVKSLELNVEIGDVGQTVVDISTTSAVELLPKLDDLGAQILSAVPRSGSVRARVPLESLEQIAELPEVVFIQPKQMAYTNRALGNAMNRIAGMVETSALVAEGDVVHLASRMRTDYGANGGGVKIGVLSDGVASLAISQAKGSLGDVTVLAGQTGEGDEGTAMLEIIHAVAPSAKLYFATAFTSAASFAENIRALRNAGCDIIVDDIFYLNEFVYQDGQDQNVISPISGGIIAEAVKDVVASGALYFASAGNGGNLAKNTSAVWEGNFRDGGGSVSPLPVDAGRIHDFGNGRLSNQITLSAPFPVTLQWADPLGKSDNDYDLYILNSAGTSILAASLNFQDGTQDAFEIVGAQAAGRRVVIAKYLGEDRFLHLDATWGRLNIATQGEVKGHSTVQGALSVAAAPAALPFGPPPNPTGPFPNAFSSSSSVELFSSDGPRRIFFRGDGSPFTPGNFSSTGGIVRQKPDITAADGVTVTGVGLFPTPFYGTSAAAPHAAAIAALLKSANPNLTLAQVRSAMIASAIDIEQLGADAVSGAGIVMATNAAVALGLQPQASLELARVEVKEVAGNGNGSLEPGETGSVTIDLKNLGAVGATGVKAALQSGSPGVFIAAQGPIDYGDIAARTGVATGNVPVNFLVSTVNACDARISLSLVVNYAGGPSPKQFPFEVQLGSGPLTIQSVLDANPPSSNSRYQPATGLQLGRMVRTFFPSGCQIDKPYPGLSTTGARRFDSYTFPTCQQTTSTCITVSITSACTGVRLFAAAYVDRFDPNDVGANYLGDSGDGPSGSIDASFTFSVPAGRSFVIVVHELNPGGAIGCSYDLKISGICDTCSPGTGLVCVQDDETNDSLLFNFLNGDYQFQRCADGTRFSGRGDIGRFLGGITLRDGLRAFVEVEKTPGGFLGRGTALLKPGALGRTYSITDRNVLNSTCGCP